MRLINQTKNTILSEDLSVANTPFSRIKGLLGEKSLEQGKALLIKPCNSIHTFFMSFPIDVIFIDKNNEVVKTISSLKPYRLSAIYFKASSVIELPVGVIQKTNTCVGDRLSLNPAL